MTLSRRSCLWLVGAGFFIMGVVYAIFDPEETVWMPQCPIYMLSGFKCPGCGSQRAVHALLQGDFGNALSANALLIFMIPFLMVTGYVELNKRRYPVFYSKLFSPVIIYLILGLILGWTLLRNIFNPGG